MSYQYYLEDFIKQPEKTVIEQIKKLKPLNYNRFYWWRNFTSKSNPLPKNSLFKDKVLNGDYELSPYYWMAQYSIYEGKKKFNPQKDTLSDQLEKLGINISKYRKLMEDYEKDESERINTFLKELLEEFYITQEQLDNELFDFDGDTKTFYLYLENKYSKKYRVKSKRGRKKRLLS